MRKHVCARPAVLAVVVAGAVALVAVLLESPGTTGGPRPAAAVWQAAAGPVPGSPEAQMFTGPVLGAGQDPSLVTFGRWYYFTQTSPDWTYITIRRARSIKGLAAAPKTVVWHGGDAGSPCCQWWAPELHFIGGMWYIYTSADNGKGNNHRLQVLQASDPLGPYIYKGQLTTPGNHWSIDPSPLQLPDGRLYLTWSGWPGDVNGRQDIYIARLASPWTVTGPRTRLSTPTYRWERQSSGIPVKVNESPEPLVDGGRVFVTYSGSACWTPGYALGLLSASISANLMSRSSWTKSAQPVLQSNPAAGIYGPASNGFFASPDGRQTWMVFHAVNNPHGNCLLERYVYAQQVTWSASGFPQFGGQPVPITTPLHVPSGDPGAP
jgi:GH43 family beta-xylosidase